MRVEGPQRTWELSVSPMQGRRHRSTPRQDPMPQEGRRRRSKSLHGEEIYAGGRVGRDDGLSTTNNAMKQALTHGAAGRRRR